MRFKYRLRLVQKLRQKYPDRIPVILNIQDVRHYLLVPCELTGKQLWISLRMKFKVNNEVMILWYSRDKIRVSSDISMYYQYIEHRNDDGFLYIDVLDRYKNQCCIM